MGVSTHELRMVMQVRVSWSDVKTVWVFGERVKLPSVVVTVQEMK